MAKDKDKEKNDNLRAPAADFLGVDVELLVFGKALLMSVDRESMIISEVPTAGNEESFWLMRANRCGSEGAVTCAKFRSIEEENGCCEVEDPDCREAMLEESMFLSLGPGSKCAASESRSVDV